MKILYCIHFTFWSQWCGMRGSLFWSTLFLFLSNYRDKLCYRSAIINSGGTVFTALYKHFKKLFWKFFIGDVNCRKCSSVHNSEWSLEKFFCVGRGGEFLQHLAYFTLPSCLCSFTSPYITLPSCLYSFTPRYNHLA